MLATFMSPAWTRCRPAHRPRPPGSGGTPPRRAGRRRRRPTRRCPGWWPVIHSATLVPLGSPPDASEAQEVALGEDADGAGAVGDHHGADAVGDHAGAHLGDGLGGRAVTTERLITSPTVRTTAPSATSPPRSVRVCRHWTSACRRPWVGPATTRRRGDLTDRWPPAVAAATVSPATATVPDTVAGRGQPLGNGGRARRHRRRRG